MSPNHDLTRGSVAGTLLRFAAPFLLANVLQSLYGAVDLFVIGKYCGADSVAAVSTGTQVTQIVTSLMTGLTLGDIVSGKLTDWLDRMYANEGSYDEVREIFDVIDLIMAHGTDRAMEEGSEAGAADFALGKAAMFVQGTWASNTIMTTNPDMQLGVFALPINEDPGCTRVNLSTSTTLAVYPESKELDLALKFANYVLDANDSSALFQACSFNPLATVHNYEAFSWVEDASAFVAAGRAYQDLVLPSSVTDEQGRLLQEYYVGSVTVDQIVERLDKAFQDANALS